MSESGRFRERPRGREHPELRATVDQSVAGLARRGGQAPACRSPRARAAPPSLPKLRRSVRAPLDTAPFVDGAPLVDPVDPAPFVDLAPFVDRADHAPFAEHGLFLESPSFDQAPPEELSAGSRTRSIVKNLAPTPEAREARPP